MITFLLAFVAQQGQLKIAVLVIVVRFVCVYHQPKGKEPGGKKYFEFYQNNASPSQVIKSLCPHNTPNFCNKYYK